MNKKLRQTVLASLLIASSFNSIAQTTDTTAQNDMENLTQYLKNLGEYMGYDLTNFCPQTGGPCNAPASGSKAAAFSSLLVNSAAASGNQLNLMTSVIGALLPAIPSGGGTTGGQQASFQVIPSTNTTLAGYANLFSKVGNQTFAQFNTPSAGTVSVSNLMDQVPYQTDPVSQALLDILSTPDASFCVNPGKGFFNPCYTGENNSAKNGGGPVISKSQVMINVIGDPPPGTGYFALPATNAQLVPQLSSDSLIGPLLFSNSNQNAGSAVNSGGSNTGLPAANQAQQASNFIRYATGLVSPLPMPNRTTYDNLYATATNASGNVPLDQQAQAKSILTNYLTSLRVYAAQSSVAISNLYSMLSKRMPQTSAAGSSNGQTSQALSEFIMATWRLYTPANPSSSNPQNNPQWISQINQASNATVQKEIAILLAEINYQLYLTRQQQERILLTQSMMMLQNSKANQPNPNISSAAAAANDTTEE